MYLAENTGQLYEKNISSNTFNMHGKIMMDNGVKKKTYMMAITDLHHRLHNTKYNRKKYPLYIDSAWNRIGVSNANHLSVASSIKVTEAEAEKREDFLRRHKKISRWINGKT